MEPSKWCLKSRFLSPCAKRAMQTRFKPEPSDIPVSGFLLIESVSCCPYAFVVYIQPSAYLDRLQSCPSFRLHSFVATVFEQMIMMKTEC